MKNWLAGMVIPGTLAVAGIVLLVVWAGTGPVRHLEARVPGMDGAPPPGPVKVAKRPEPGTPVRGPGQPSTLRGDWPWFRGPRLDAIADDGIRLARQWPPQGPKRLWSVKLGEGYAAAAVRDGCVYVLDHVADEAAERLARLSPGYVDRSTDTLRCLSLDDGREIWRNGYPVVVPLNHGRSRTIPAVVGKHVITLGPRCQAAGWDAETGACHWLLDLVHDFGTTEPPWYAGQCPLVDTATDRLILAPGGKTLVMAVDYRTGKVLWQSPNPRGWAMTHVSVVPMEVAGRRQYIYCGTGGVAGVAADDGSILWDTTDWQIAMATCPSPVVIGDGRVFLSGGYNAGAMMLEVAKQGDRFAVKTLFRLKPDRFGSEQQTPVLFNGHLYGVRQKDKQLVCLDLKGNEVWNSGRDKFGSGPYMIADGLIYVLADDGLLTMAEATPQGYRRLARAQVIDDGQDSWGPMALVAGRLIVRDMTRMICLYVAEK